MLKITSRSSKKTPMIAIIGPDGVGKSTILSLLANEYRHKKIKGVFILKRFNEENSGELDEGTPVGNYAKPPRSIPVTLLKLGFKVAPWLFKYYTRLLPMRHSGTLVICDHFYFLMIMLDPLKFRISGPDSMRKFLYRVLPKPDFYIYLDAPVDVVYSRKQQTTREELAQLIERHHEFLSGIPNRVYVDANRPVTEVMVDISQTISRIIDASMGAG
ncbi:MAG: hypothetical protein QY328_04180 [Anaerolineales bacterium]|jgi:thymidylate kinase|nr:MAG: hypothetical protein QY328_04180 [Anaerolineales bacterium]